MIKSTHENVNGFTLIEILIALLIFILLSAATTTALYLVFTSGQKVNRQSDRLSEIQLALATIEHDIAQFINRPVRNQELHYHASIQGNSHELSFTRAGIFNPLNQFRQSNLQRISYEVKQGVLYRKNWPILDGYKPKQFKQRMLLQRIKSFNFSYLDKNLTLMHQLNNDALNSHQKTNAKILIPKAIQLNITLNDWGAISLLFIIPTSNYGMQQQGKTQ